MRQQESEQAFLERSEKYFERAASPIYRRIQRHLFTSDDSFSIAIKGQVIIDELITIAIQTRAPILRDLKHLVRDDLNTRLAIISHLYPDVTVFREIAPSLVLLNKLRKDYAHSLDHDEVEEGRRLQEFIDEIMRARGFKELAYPDRAGQVRQGILILALAIGSAVYGAQFLTLFPEKDIYGNPANE